MMTVEAPRSALRLVLALAIILLVFGTLVLRVSWYPVVTSDYTYFTRVWFEQLAQSPGLTAFKEPFANYAPLYLYLLKLLTFIPLSSLWLIKSLSLLADLGIAFVAVQILRHTLGWPTRRLDTWLVGGLFAAIPTLMLNSSLWGQSDALYALPVLLSLYALLRDRSFAAALWFGIALSIKVQSVFFFPVLIGYLLQKREDWRYSIVPIGIFLLSLVPALLGGGSFGYWATIYGQQAAEYPYLSLSAPSIYAFVVEAPLSPSKTSLLFWLGLATAGALALWIVRAARTIPRLRAERWVWLSFLSVLVLPYFLPRMHERYFYLADVFAFLYAWLRPERWYLALLTITASFLAYLPYLSSQVAFLADARVDLRLPSVLLASVILILATDLLFKRGVDSRPPEPSR